MLVSGAACIFLPHRPWAVARHGSNRNNSWKGTERKQEGCARGVCLCHCNVPAGRPSTTVLLPAWVAGRQSAGARSAVGRAAAPLPATAAAAAAAILAIPRLQEHQTEQAGVHQHSGMACSIQPGQRAARSSHHRTRGAPAAGTKQACMQHRHAAWQHSHLQALQRCALAGLAISSARRLARPAKLVVAAGAGSMGSGQVRSSKEATLSSNLNPVQSFTT